MNRKRILICDDNETQYNNLKGMLEDYYDVERSTHYLSVVDDLQKYAPIHLLILDLGFGKKEYVGQVCIPEVTNKFPNMKIIIFSGILTDLDAQDQALNIALDLVHYPQVVNFLSPAASASKVLFDVHKALGTSKWLQEGNEQIWLLHVSDLQFGGKGLPDDGEALANNIGETIQSFLDYPLHSGETGPRKFPAITVFSGDLTEHARPDEFREFERFAYKLSQWMSEHSPELTGLLGKHNIITVPGNHDVNWDISFATNLQLQKDPTSGLSQLKYLDGVENRRKDLSFLRRYTWAPFCEMSVGEDSNEHRWAYEPGYKIINLKNELGIIFICLNSSLWGVDHLQQSAYVPTSIWLEIQKQLNRLDENKDAARILVVHHTLANSSRMEDQLKLMEHQDDSTHITDKISRTCNISLMFTGHIHKLAACEIDTNSDKRKLIHVGAGTARSSDLNEHCNPQFNLIKLGDLSLDTNKFQTVTVYPFHYNGRIFCSYSAFGEGMRQWKTFNLLY